MYRSLAACDGVVLLVDANHGVQAQTVANYYLALSKNLTVVPVLNKVDLKNADPERVCAELETLFDIDPSTVLRVNIELKKFGLRPKITVMFSADFSKIRNRRRGSAEADCRAYSTTTG